MIYYNSTLSGLFSRQFDSLTGVNTSSIYPNQTIIVAGTKSNLPVIGINESKNILPVYDNNSDAYISMIIGAIEDQVGRYIKLDLTKRQRQSYWKNPMARLVLSYGPHGEVSSVVAKDIQGNATTLVLGTHYYVQGLEFKEIQIISMPIDVYSITVTYWSGYEDGECPDAIRMACVQELNFQYKNRQDANQTSVAIVNGLTMESRMLLETYIRKI